MNKKIYLSILALIILFRIQSQTTFNNRFSLGFPNSILTSLVISDSIIYTSGVISDSSEFNSVGALFAKFDLNGNFIDASTVVDLETAFQPWPPFLHKIDEDCFVVCGTANNANEGDRGFLIKYDIDGNPLLIKQYPNPYYPDETFIATLAMSPTIDGGYISVSNIQNLGAYNAQIYASKFDENFNLEWDTEVGTNFNELSRVVIIDQEDGFIVGGWRNNKNQVNYNFISQVYLFKLNSLGEIMWEYLSPEEECWKYANDMLLLDDKSLIVSSNTCWEWKFPSGPNDSLGIQMWRNTIFKLDSLHNRVWTRSFTNGWDAPQNENARIVQALDQSGYVAVGLQFLADSTVAGADQNFGWLTKVSEDGDSLWARYLYILDDIKHHRHKVHDLKACPDGGYVMCGEAVDQSPGGIEPRQQAWLLKVDEYGCLVPGCQGVINDVEEGEEERRAEWLLYPNPATDYLNVFFRAPEVSPSGVFRIWDHQGHLMKEFKAQMPEITMIVPLSNWPAGTYVLQYLEKGKPVLMEQFVKQ